MPILNDEIFKNEFFLDRNCLVEASAGTGKTYSIQTLYLRLVLEQGLPVQKILVVTFTEAATKELRDRLRRILHDAYQRVKTENEPQNDRIAKILQLPVKPYPPVNKVLEGDEGKNGQELRLRRALLDFDEAPIFTIHGFCSRTLKRFAFECSHPFDAELVPNMTAALDELCEDWWRKNMYPENALFKAQLCTLCGDILTLSRLKAAAGQWISKPDSKLVPDPDENTPAENQVITAINDLAEQWKNNSAAIKKTLQEARRQNFLTDDVAANIPEKADRLVKENTTDKLLEFLSVLSRFLKFPNDSQQNTYLLPEPIKLFGQACDPLAKLIANKKAAVNKGNWKLEGITKQDWSILLDTLDRTWNNNKEKIKRFAKEDLHYVDTKLDAGKCEKSFAALDALNTVTANLKNVIRWFSTNEITVPAKLKWKKPEEIKTLDKSFKQLKADAAAWLNHELATALQSIREQYFKRKHERQTLSYDDLLLNVRDALRDTRNNKQLLKSLRREYQAALIDEFQDTDPVQYDIFKIIFIDNTESTPPVFLVGDPKQAIYSFRSGDIYTYYAAARKIEKNSRFKLNTNYRSEKRLIDAVNQIFSDPALNEKRTFKNDQITYSENLEAQGKDDNETLKTNGEQDKTPFKIWFYPRINNESVAKNSPFALQIYADTAKETARILTDKQTTIGDRQVQPSDIAILVRTHDEARMITRELAERNVPAVRQKTGKVFDSSEAKNMALVLAAVHEARNPRRIRSALATNLFACTNADIAAMAGGETGCSGEQQSDSLEKYTALFQDAHDIWRKNSFIAAMNHLLRETKMREYILGLDDGERRLTNLLQLVDLTHHAITENRLSMENTLTWFARQLNPETRENNDEYEMRLETDEEAVKIMTIFSSKGLQFPIVFIPTMWLGLTRGRSKAKVTEYHQISGENADAPDLATPLVINLNKDETKQQQAEKEQEFIRLFYVAATRAINRTYVMWGGAPKASPLAHILGADEKWEVNENIETRLSCKLKQDETLAVSVTDQTNSQVPETNYSRPGNQLNECKIPDKKPNIDKTHGHTSFSGISPEYGAKTAMAHGFYDFDEADTSKPEPVEDKKALEISILNFPAGAKTGECWHRILETLDFQADNNTVKKVVEEQLALFRLDKGKTEKIKLQKRNAVSGMVTKLLETGLYEGTGQKLKLSDIAMSQRCSEMNFNFSLPLWQNGTERQTGLITDVLKKHWLQDRTKVVFLAKLTSWDNQIPQGFMTGFIDLIFEHEGKYYIVDWKSNRRSGQIDDFKPAGLYEEMAEHVYFLQYLIYNVAVHNYLRGCNKNYDYNKNFGGVFYVFLRGLAADGHGIYYDKPELEMINDLSKVLGDFS